MKKIKLGSLHKFGGLLGEIVQTGVGKILENREALYLCDFQNGDQLEFIYKVKLETGEEVWLTESDLSDLDLPEHFN